MNHKPKVKPIKAWAVTRRGSIFGMWEYPNCQFPIFPNKTKAIQFIGTLRSDEYKIDVIPVLISPIQKKK